MSLSRLAQAEGQETLSIVDCIRDGRYAFEDEVIEMLDGKTRLGQGQVRDVSRLSASMSEICIPSVDKGKHGFGGQKCAHTSSKSLTIRGSILGGLFIVWPHFCSVKTAAHLTGMDFRVIFAF